MKHEIEDALKDGDIKQSLELLLEYLQEQKPSLQTDVYMLLGQYSRVYDDFYIKGIISREDFDLAEARVRRAILELLKKVEESQPSKKDSGRGKLLHRIPDEMKLREPSKCLVRIAYDEETVKKGLPIDKDTVISDVRISEIMSVELLDMNSPEAFQIKTYTDEEQFIISDDYTQWCFLVTPLLEGKHSLILKVSVIEVINNKERKRNIIVDKEIEIGIHSQLAEAIDFEESGLRVDLGRRASLPEPKFNHTPDNELAEDRFVGDSWASFSDAEEKDGAISKEKGNGSDANASEGKVKRPTKDHYLSKETSRATDNERWPWKQEFNREKLLSTSMLILKILLGAAATLVLLKKLL